MPLFCSKCGAKNIANAKFCHKCGAGLGKSNPAGNTKRLVVVAIAIIAVVGGILLLTHNSQLSAQQIKAQLCQQNSAYCNATVSVNNSTVSSTIQTTQSTSIQTTIPTTTVSTTTTSTSSTTTVTTTASTQCDTVNSEVLVGYSITCGQFTVALTSLTAQQATISVSDYGVVTNESEISIGNEYQLNVSGTLFYIYIPTATPSQNVAYLEVSTSQILTTSTTTIQPTTTQPTTSIYPTTTTISGSSGLSNQCSITGSSSSYSGTTILILNGQVCSLKSNYRFTSTFTTYGPTQIVGAFSTSGSAIEVYLVNQSDLNYYTSTGTITSYQCTIGSVIKGSINCEVPAGTWSILFINNGPQTSMITYTTDVNASYIDYAEVTPSTIVSSGTNWSLQPNYHESESFTLNNAALITGGFSSSGAVSGYLMNSAEYGAFNSNGTVTGYYCTTGTVISGGIGCILPAGSWYFVLVNSNSQSSVNVNWESSLTAYGLLNGSTNDDLYDEQFGLTFADSYTSLAYNTTAIAQVDTSGVGPAYLLNGYSNTGYWYQIGLSYNWADGTQHESGFNINYNVFAPSGAVVYPSGGGGGLLALSGPVNNGDTVQLGLSFSNGEVLMTAHDLNTGAQGSLTYSAEGATEFVGNPSGTQTNGFFTGLMTEWYHVVPWYGGGNLVSYNPYGAISSPAWLWVDEFYCYTQSCGSSSRISIFTNSTSTYISPNYKFVSNGATLVYSSNGKFTTGSN